MIFKFTQITKKPQTTILLPTPLVQKQRSTMVKPCGSLFIGLIRRNLGKRWMSTRPVSTLKVCSTYNPTQTMRLTSTIQRFSPALLSNPNPRSGNFSIQQPKPDLNLNSSPFLSAYLTRDHRLLMSIFLFSVSMKLSVNFFVMNYLR